MEKKNSIELSAVGFVFTEAKQVFMEARRANFAEFSTTLRPRVAHADYEWGSKYLQYQSKPRRPGVQSGSRVLSHAGQGFGAAAVS